MGEYTYIEQVAIQVWQACGYFDADDIYPEDERALWLGYAVLCLTKGEATTSEDVHHAWSAWALANLSYVHRSIVPFSELAAGVQAYDDEYRDAIHKAAQ